MPQALFIGIWNQFRGESSPVSSTFSLLGDLRSQEPSALGVPFGELLIPKFYSIPKDIICFGPLSMGVSRLLIFFCGLDYRTWHKLLRVIAENGLPALVSFPCNNNS